MDRQEGKNLCKCCGAALDYRAAAGGVIRCAYCGTSWTLPSFGLSAYVTAQLVSGENCIDRGDFDEARMCFEKAVAQAPNEPEAHFGLAKAKLRVQFIVDRSGAVPCVRPICHEISSKFFTEDADYLKAVELATDAQREVYRAQGRAIDHVREEFYRLQKEGLDYDVFLCTKVSKAAADDTGDDFTPESHETLQLYYFLKEKKLKPFYSEVDAKGRTGEDYEALIYYALLKSESMVVVCFNEEYLHTPWVKNEYTRFTEMMKQGEKARGALTILYRDAKHPIGRLPAIEGTIEGIACDSPVAFSRVENHVRKFLDFRQQREENDARREEVRRIREEAALKREENEAHRLQLQAEREKRKQDEQARRHELAMHRAEEKRRLEAERAERRRQKEAEKAEGKRARKRKRSAAAENFKDGFSSFFSSLGEGMKRGMRILNIILTVLDVVGCLFAVSYPFAASLAAETAEYTAYLIVLCVLAGVLLVHGVVILIGGGGGRILFSSFVFEGVIGAICILIGWFCHSMGDWLWVQFAFGIALGVVSVFSLNFEIERYATACIWAFAIFASLCGLLFTIQTQKTAVDGFYYEVLEDGTASVCVYKYDMEELVIPDEIDGYRVTQVSRPYVERDNVVGTVVIPDGIMRIGSSAFKGCTSLKEISIAETVISVGASAFEGCTALTEIELPDSVRELGKSAFASCSRLVDVNIPTSLEVIPDSCFKNCSALAAIAIPDNIRTIETNAFRSCINLKTVTLPAHSVWGVRFLFFIEHFRADGDMAATIRELTEECDYTFDRNS